LADASTLIRFSYPILRSLAKNGGVVVLVPLEREHAALRIGHVQMPDVFSGPHDDLRVFLFAGQMIEVHYFARTFFGGFLRTKGEGRWTGAQLASITWS
jgi:hypothetical protein